MKILRNIRDFTKMYLDIIRTIFKAQQESCSSKGKRQINHNQIRRMLTKQMFYS